MILEMSVAANTTLATLRRLSDARPARLRPRAMSLAEDSSSGSGSRRRRSRPRSGNLSGGNQQKVALARWLAADPAVLILDEPTQGVDVGAKAEIHRLMGELAAQGLAILMISSELPEILGMSDRIAVMHGGTIVGSARPRRRRPRKRSWSWPSGTGSLTAALVMIESLSPRDCRSPRRTPRCSWSAGAWPRRGFFEADQLRPSSSASAPGPGGGGRDDAGDPLPADRHLGRLAVQRLRRRGRPARQGGAADAAGRPAGRCWPGRALGAVNGLLVAGLGLPSIVVTLATLVILRESLRCVREGEFVRDLPPGFQWFGLGQDAGPMAGRRDRAGGLRRVRLGAAEPGRPVGRCMPPAPTPRPRGWRASGRGASSSASSCSMGALAGLAALLNAVRFADVDPNAGHGAGAAGDRRGGRRRRGDLGRPRHAGRPADRRAAAW